MSSPLLHLPPSLERVLKETCGTGNCWFNFEMDLDFQERFAVISTVPREDERCRKGGIQMQNIASGYAKRESECSCRSCERVLFVVSNDKGIENRGLTGLIKLVLKVLQEVESWCYTGGSWMQRMQVQDSDSDVTETDPEGKGTSLVDKKVDVPG